MRLPGKNLAVRLAIVGALQVFVLLFVAALAVPLSFYFQDRASPQGIVRRVQGALGDVEELERRVTQLHDTHRVGISLYDGDGNLVVSNVSPALEVRDAFEPEIGLGPPGAALSPGRPPGPRGLGAPPLGSEFHAPPFGAVPLGPPQVFEPLGDGPNDSRSPRQLGERRRMWPPGPLDLLRGGGGHEPPLMVMSLRDGDAFFTLAVQLPRLSPNYIPLIAIVVTGILVVWLGASLTARFITNPLERLSSVVGQFGAGELTARSDLARRDEVGLLATAFNQMADRIQSLRQTERELLSNVAHELRTPLARIRVALEIAEDSDGATAKKALLGINEDLRELESLIEDVFTATRLQSSVDGAGLVLRKGEVSVEALVHSVVSRFSANHPTRPLELHAAAKGTYVFGDEVLLRRALSNLLENAHAYTPDTSLPITLRVSSGVHANAASALAARANRPASATADVSEGAGARCVFSVEDAGIGIDPLDHARVFLPFYRTEQSRSRATGGVGLGLTLTKRIVEAHAGALELESALGKGTTVRLVLPTGLD